MHILKRNLQIKPDWFKQLHFEAGTMPRKWRWEAGCGLEQMQWTGSGTRHRSLLALCHVKEHQEAEGAPQLMLRCRIRPDVLPKYAPDPTTKSGLAFRHEGASLGSNTVLPRTWTDVIWGDFLPNLLPFSAPGHICSCPVIRHGGAGSFAQEEWKKRPLMLVTTACTGTQIRIRIIWLSFHFMCSYAALTTRSHISSK